MVFASQAVAADRVTESAPPPPEKMRLRLRFRKAGDLRLVSHHDLMKVFERMVRRADLPIVQTQGFNPHAKITFALSLALGIIGGEEIVDLDMAGGLSPEEIKQRLLRQTPPGMEILDLRAVDAKSKLRVCRAWYRCTVPADSILADSQPVGHVSNVPAEPERHVENMPHQSLPERIADFLASPASYVDRLKPQPRRLNVRPYVNELRLEGESLIMALWITPYGAARPEEILRFIGLAGHYESGDLILERTRLELENEVPAEAGPMPEVLQNANNQREPMETNNDTGLSETQDRKLVSSTAAEPAARATPLISNPMEFDS